MMEMKAGLLQGFKDLVIVHPEAVATRGQERIQTQSIYNSDDMPNLAASTHSSSDVDSDCYREPYPLETSVMDAFAGNKIAQHVLQVKSSRPKRAVCKQLSSTRK